LFISKGKEKLKTKPTINWP